MEKLLKLLNKFEKERIEKVNSKWLPIKLSFRPYTEDVLTNVAYKSAIREIVSKDYWFIKRLVDKNMIDLFKMPKKFEEIWFFWWVANRTVMLLSMSDNPIEDLIYYLMDKDE